MITYRTTDGTKWGTGKGSNLTPTEVDDNFWTLHERVAELESGGIEGVTIADITVLDGQMFVIMSDATEYGPFPLPTAAFNWTGDFQPNHDYSAYDLLTANGSLYLVLTAHTSGPTFSMGPNYQLLMPLPSVFDAGFFFPQKPGFGIPVDEPMCAYMCARPWFFEEDAPGSLAKLRVAPASTLVIPIHKNGVEIGTITFDTTDGVIAVDATDFVAGDIIQLIRPTLIDDDARDLMVTIQGNIGDG